MMTTVHPITLYQHATQKVGATAVTLKIALVDLAHVSDT